MRQERRIDIAIAEAPDRSAADDRLFPLVVDLDGTLIRTDMLWECFVQAWRSPITVVRAFVALVSRGKAAFKEVLARQATIDPATLPYRDDVLEFVHAQRAAGRHLILATAAHRTLADRVANHLGIFASVLATEDRVNLSGDRKREALEAIFGKRGFDYIGDSRKDLPVFAAARRALLVGPSGPLLRKAQAVAEVSRVFATEGLSVKTLARALRLHQWSKNVLLAVPLLTAHQIFNLQAWANVGLAFLAFGLVASATYLVNDLSDLQADRRHAKKRDRPLASGRMPVSVGVGLAVALGISGAAIASAFLPVQFTLLLAGYVALTLAYTFDLKRRLFVDALALAVLYTFRILAGGAAVGVSVSEWLLMFSLFMFVSLAFLKRFVELEGRIGSDRLAGRGYAPVDLETIRTIGIASGLMSVLVFALYINSPAVSQLYRSPAVLWLICPLVFYWIARLWLLAARGKVHHDPVVFALMDWRSYVIGFGVILAMLAAKASSINLPW